jgi:hypothetical protein
VNGLLKLGLELPRSAARAAGHGAERATLATLDAVLESRIAREAVDRVLTSELAAQAVRKAVDGPLVDAVAPELERIAERALDSPAAERIVVRVLESRLLDEAVRRVLEGEELWIVVDEIAQSPAVTEAITRQSIGFADQVAGEVRDRSRHADAWLERAARRALRRPPAQS